MEKVSGILDQITVMFKENIQANNTVGIPRILDQRQFKTYVEFKETALLLQIIELILLIKLLETDLFSQQIQKRHHFNNKLLVHQKCTCLSNDRQVRNFLPLFKQLFLYIFI